MTKKTFRLKIWVLNCHLRFFESMQGYNMTFLEWFVTEINASSDLIKSSKFTQWRKEKVQDSKNTILIGPDVLDSHTGEFGFVREFRELSNEYLILRIFRYSDFFDSPNLSILRNGDIFVCLGLLGW